MLYTNGFNKRLQSSFDINWWNVAFKGTRVSTHDYKCIKGYIKSLKTKLDNVNWEEFVNFFLQNKLKEKLII